MKRFLSFFMLSFFSFICVYAYDFEVNGLYYNITSETSKTVELTRADLVIYKDGSGASVGMPYYEGDIAIPSTVVHNGNSYVVTSIGKHTFFGCQNLTSVSVPSSVTYIDDYAFQDCTSLKEITIPNSVTSVGKKILSGSNNIASNIYNSTLYIKHVSSSSETSYLIPTGITTICDGAFAGCKYLASIGIPSSVKKIGEEAFGACSGLSSVSLPESVTEVGTNAFSGCYNLRSPIYNSMIFAKMNERRFSGSNTYFVSGTYSIPSGIKTIAGGAFSTCTQLTGVNIPSTVTSIGEYAFSNCWALKSLTLPNSLRSIGNYAFYKCSSLTNMNIPNTVTEIGDGVFEDARSISSPIYNSSNLVFVPTSAGTSYSIPSGIQTICGGAFYNNTAIETVEIPSSVLKIGVYAFYGCTNLKSIQGGASVKKLCNGVFFDCSKLTSYPFSDALEYIGGSAFNGCTNLNNAVLPMSVTEIMHSAFYRCSSIQSISLGNNVSFIGYNAFGSCKNVKEITCAAPIVPSTDDPRGGTTFWDVPTNIPVYVPMSCVDLYKSSLQWEKFTNIIGKNMPIESGKCGENLTYIISSDYSLVISGTGDMYSYNSSSVPWYSYRNKITNIVVDEGTTSLSPYAFYGCSDVKSISLPSTLKSLGTYCMAYCSSIESITLPGAISTYGTYALAYCTKLKELKLEEGIRGIGNSGVRGCTSLTKIVLPSTLTSINKNSFRSCPSLKTVIYYASSTPTIGEDIFRDDYSSIGTGTLFVPKESVELFKATYPWSLFGHVRPLYCTDMLDMEPFVSESTINRDELTYTRTFNNTNWQALYVPFGMSYDDWAEDFEVAEINNFHEYDDDNNGTIDRTVLEVIKKTSGSIDANTPYLIRAKEACEKTIKLTDATLFTTVENSIDCSSVKTKYTFIGTYNGVSGEEMYNNGYYALAGGALKQAASPSASLGAFRWYLKAEPRSSSTAKAKAGVIKVCMVGAEDEAMGIANAEEMSADAEYFTLSGRKVKCIDAPGVYVVKRSNGTTKKVIKK